MATIGELWVNINARTDNLERGLDNAERSASGFGSVMGNVMKNVASFVVYDIGKKLADGLVNAAKAGIDYNATLETSRIAWSTLLGTQEKANKMLKDIEKFAATTPFEKMGVDNMAKQLHNAGFEGDALFEQLTKFGDMGGAFGVQQASLEEMVRQYSQVQQAGVAYTEDLNILQDRGIPIYKAIAEECGISTAEVKKWASEGKISSEIYQAALDNVAKSVEGGMAKQSKSFNGMVSTLKDNFSIAAGILAQPIFDALKNGLQNVLPFLDKIITSLSENGLMGTIQRFAPGIEPFVQTAISIFQTMGDTMGTIIQSMTDFWNEHSSWLMPLITFVWNFIAGFIMSTITAIGNVVESGLAVIDGIINFFQNLFSGNFQGCWESIKQIFSNAIQFVWNWMQVNFAVKLPGMIKDFVSKIPTMISTMWSGIKSFFSSGVSAIWNFASSGFSNIVSSCRSFLSNLPSIFRQFIGNCISYLQGIPSQMVTMGKNMIQGLINGIKNMGSTVVGAIKGVVDGAINGAKKLLGINSPSKVFTKFGKWTGEGLAIGIDSENNRVNKATKGLASSVIGGYNANLKTNIDKGPNKGTNSRSESTSEQIPIIINIDGRKVFEVMSPYMGRASRGW